MKMQIISKVILVLTITCIALIQRVKSDCQNCQKRQLRQNQVSSLLQSLLAPQILQLANNNGKLQIVNNANAAVEYVKTPYGVVEETVVPVGPILPNGQVMPIGPLFQNQKALDLRTLQSLQPQFRQPIKQSPERYVPMGPKIGASYAKMPMANPPIISLPDRNANQNVPYFAGNYQLAAQRLPPQNMPVAFPPQNMPVQTKYEWPCLARGNANPFLPAASPVSALAPPTSNLLPPVNPNQPRSKYLRKIPIPPPSM